MTIQLHAVGHTVTNPAEHISDGNTWNDCMHLDIAALMERDTVVTLPSWWNPKGSRLSVLIAVRRGMAIVNAHDLLARVD